VWDHVVSKAKKRHAELQGRHERAGPGWPEEEKMEIEVNTVNPRPSTPRPLVLNTDADVRSRNTESEPRNQRV